MRDACNGKDNKFVSFSYEALFNVIRPCDGVDRYTKHLSDLRKGITGANNIEADLGRLVLGRICLGT